MKTIRIEGVLKTNNTGPCDPDCLFFTDPCVLENYNCCPLRERNEQENIQMEVSDKREPSRDELIASMRAIQDSWSAAMAGNMLPLNTAFDKIEKLLKRIKK